MTPMDSRENQTLPDQPSEITFGELADRYLAANPRRKKPEEFAKERETIERELRPILGPRPASAITRQDGEHLVKDMMDRGSDMFAAEQMRVVAGNVFKFGIAKKLIDDNPLALNYGVPRAWSLPLLGLGILILVGIAQEGVGSADANAVRFGGVFPLWGAWRVWTKKGKYSFFDLSDGFAVDGKRIGKAHLAVWVVACVLVALMLRGAIGEVLE